MTDTPERKLDHLDARITEAYRAVEACRASRLEAEHLAEVRRRAEDDAGKLWFSLIQLRTGVCDELLTRLRVEAAGDGVGEA